MTYPFMEAFSIMRFIAFALAVIITSGIAHSAEAPNPKGTKVKNSAEDVQRGTDEKPFSVKILPSESAKDEAAQAEKWRKEKSIQDQELVDATVLLARVTIALAFFTFLLWLATYCLARDAKATAAQQAKDMQHSLTIAQQSAGAAQMSAYAFTEAAKALLAVQRPYIFVVGVTHVQPEFTEQRVTYSLVNYGGVPAIVEHLAVSVQESPYSRPDHPPLGVDQSHEMVNDPIIPSQGKRELWQPYRNGITSDERARFFQIQVNYRGVFTQSHVTVATWRFDRLSDSFVPFGGETYNSIK